MAEFIRIRGWDKYQHYKDRNPPWIKLHRELLTSLTWALADDASRLLAIACMLLAAATDNNIPADPAYVKRVAYLNQLPDFSVLIQLEFLEVVDSKGKPIEYASSLLASASALQAVARPETETETEQRHKKLSARPARGGNSQTAKATGETRHTRIKQLVEGFYQDWAGAECPWDGSEAAQLKRLLDATPHWVDSQLVTCLENMARSDCVAPGARPREWLEMLPKFLKGPLDQFKNPKAVTNGRQVSKAAEREQRILANAYAASAGVGSASASLSDGVGAAGIARLGAAVSPVLDRGNHGSGERVDTESPG